MLQPKTHFEQVPLEAVMKIVAEQLWQEEIDGTAPARDASGKTFGGDPPQKSACPRGPW